MGQLSLHPSGLSFRKASWYLLPGSLGFEGSPLSFKHSHIYLDALLSSHAHQKPGSSGTAAVWFLQHIRVCPASSCLCPDGLYPANTSSKLRQLGLGSFVGRKYILILFYVTHLAHDQDSNILHLQKKDDTNLFSPFPHTNTMTISVLALFTLFIS